MENTQKTELSSDLTPKGGTNGEKVKETEESGFVEQDSKPEDQLTPNDTPLVEQESSEDPNAQSGADLENTGDGKIDTAVQETTEAVEQASTEEEQDPGNDTSAVKTNEEDDSSGSVDAQQPQLESEDPAEVEDASGTDSTPSSNLKKGEQPENKDQDSGKKEDADVEASGKKPGNTAEEDKDLDEDQDFSKRSAEDIVELVEKLARHEDAIKAEKILRKTQGRIKQLRAKARSEALKKFKEEGGVEDDFGYKPDELFERFDANARLIQDRKHTCLKDLERQKQENLAKAEVLLEQLREFLDGSESSSSFKAFKEIQNEWKSLGPLPGSHYKSLWANYNALVNRFYDTRSIYFELKELDRKKNLEYKIQLCEKAEALEDVKDLKQAIIQLNELHHEFKHTGPVPLVDQEPVWQRFKAASDKVYARRKEFNTALKKELKHNLKAKTEIAEKVQEFTEFNSERIKDWNTKTREILDLQKKWEAIGGLPREKAKDINKKFWSSFKSYFHKKNEFFKKLEGQRSENLKLKEDLIKQAEELKSSTEWDETAKKLKEIQQRWKDIGPVPEKVRNEVFARFKSACDYFFEKKRGNTQGGPKDYAANLEKKKTIIKEIKKLPKGGEKVEDLKDLQLQFYEVGFVPKSEVSKIQDEYNKALNEFLDEVEDLDEETKQDILIENKVEKIRHSPNADRKIYQKEHNLRKQIGKIENDIAVWKNNVEFFADTKNAEKLKNEFNKKITAASEELEQLRKQLKAFVAADN